MRGQPYTVWVIRDAVADDVDAEGFPTAAGMSASVSYSASFNAMTDQQIRAAELAGVRANASCRFDLAADVQIADTVLGDLTAFPPFPPGLAGPWKVVNVAPRRTFLEVLVRRPETSEAS